jgi:hypothetical protein
VTMTSAAMKLAVTATLTITMAVSACGKSGSRDGSSTGGKPAVTIDVAAVNALVPAALRDKLVFERRDLVIERDQHTTTYTIAAPKGWPQVSKKFAHLKPEDGGRSFTRFGVGSNCDGECTPKPWEAIADKVNFAPRARGKIVRDDRSPGRRSMIVDGDAGDARTTDVVVAWWADGDSRYHTCIASLDEALRAAAPAFEKACQAVAIDGSD